MLFQEEEEERSDRWNSFLDRQAESSELATDGLVVGEGEKVLGDEAAGQEADTSSEKGDCVGMSFEHFGAFSSTLGR